MDRYQETFNTWDKLAEAYQNKFMDLDLYDDTYDAFLKLITASEHPEVLEIGCGPGNITKYLLTKNPELKITALDVSPNMVKLAKKNSPKASFLVMDTRDIATINTKFDAFIAGFCIPYLSESDCLKLISDSNKLLKDSGVLYLSFVEGNYNQSGYQMGSTGDKIYFYYHNQEGLEKFLKDCGFKTEKVFRKHYTKADQSEEIHTILISKKYPWFTG